MIRPLSAALLALSLIVPPTASFAERHEPAIKASNARVSTSNGPKKQSRTALHKAAKETDKRRAELKSAVAAAKASLKPVRGRIWCVPFARAVTGIEIRGNARTWWNQAAGKYQRGSEPKIGAVMNFSGSRKMPMGHVAVVSNVVDSRRVLVDQANWERNRITQDTLVVDVSARNDWSQVRVANPNGTLGRVNPVYGFIYR
ncbi:CHAP domain-containing protein [Gemmobacter sp. LW-1]|jgi:surface antigen|uniref:CHAP domain-containing protein n=1 Tax=Gemmobacter sp. LW-1 TaxID=1529005 RepID=UPI0006C73B71|nr:CHAP domain-containing protein [Gemmobacter sp. LW-1]